MKKALFFALLLTFNTAHTEAFSLKEINAIEPFELVQPKFLTTSDSTKLAYYGFVNDEPKSIAIVYTGAGLYGNQTYQYVAKTLNEKHRIGCYIFDLRGHGHSEGPRSDAPSINRVLLDVDEGINFVHQQHPHARIYLVGHSSGAGLLINYAANFTDPLVAGYLFLAPYLGPKSDTFKTHENNNDAFIRKARTWLFILGSIFSNSFITHWNTIYFNWPKELTRKDPLILTTYTYVMACATTPYKIDTLLPYITKPTGIFIGENDEQFIPEKVVCYGEKLATNQVTIEIVKNANHLSILLEAPTLVAHFISLATTPS